MSLNAHEPARLRRSYIVIKDAVAPAEVATLLAVANERKRETGNKKLKGFAANDQDALHWDKSYRDLMAHPVVCPIVQQLCGARSPLGQRRDSPPPADINKPSSARVNCGNWRLFCPALETGAPQRPFCPAICPATATAAESLFFCCALGHAGEQFRLDHINVHARPGTSPGTPPALPALLAVWS